MKYKKINLKNYKDKRGSLTPIYLKKKLKINIKRIFYINGKKGLIRGNHAHKKCVQCFVQLRGKCKISLSNKKEEKNIVLNDKKKIILVVYPKIWTRMKYLTNDNLTLILCSHEYDKKDYIKDFKNI